MHLSRVIAGLVLAVVLVVVPGVLPGAVVPARAGRDVGAEWWFGGGVNSPDYNEQEIVVIRAGGGVLLWERVSFGASAQADRDHWFGFGYAGVVLPAIGSVEPFGRIHAGRRDDSGDDVLQWSAGLRYGVPAAKFYLEVFEIIEPGDGIGACLGIVF